MGNGNRSYKISFGFSKKGNAGLNLDPYALAQAAVSAALFVANVTWLPSWLIGPAKWLLTRYIFYPAVTWGIHRYNASVIDDLFDKRQVTYLNEYEAMQNLDKKENVTKEELYDAVEKMVQAHVALNSNRRPDGLLDTK